MGFSCTDKDDITRSFMTRTGQEVREPIMKVTMPLFAEDKGQGWLCATGVLLRVCETHFILSAAHVFDNWPRPIPLHITDGVNGNQLFGIGEVTLRRSPTSNPADRLIDDPYDVCACEISHATAERICAAGAFKFLELSGVDPGDQQNARSWHMVLGFPGDLNQAELAPGVLGSVACAYATFLYLGERGIAPLEDAKRGIHILTDYGPTTTLDDSGQNVIPPDPRGMSGGGMWRIAEHGIDMGDWSLKHLKLIGIQSAYYEEEWVLRGTRIEHVLGFIYRGYEDLRPEMELHYGKEKCKKWLD
jgi:hypothetical protein